MSDHDRSHHHHPLPGMRSLCAAQIEAASACAALGERLGAPGRGQLIQAQKDAARALDLRGAVRHLLEKLCACYAGKPVKGDIMVWPSNQWLMAATGLDERTIRRAIARLIGLGLVIPKDSPRRYRYPVKRAGDAVEDAFGFILTPLIHRHAEFAGMVRAAEERAKELAAQDDEISRLRLAARAALTAALPYDRDGRAAGMLGELAALERQVPRRDRPGDRAAAIETLGALRGAAEAVFYELSREFAGLQAKSLETQVSAREMPGSNSQNVRLSRAKCPALIKEPENSNEIYKAADKKPDGEAGDLTGPPEPDDRNAPAEPPVPLSLVIEACPDLADAGVPCWSVADLIAIGKILRPGFGASADAWVEGERGLGAAWTALLAIYVHQIACDDVAANGPPARGSRRASHGGLFRSLIRKSVAGQFKPATALLELRRKRLS